MGLAILLLEGFALLVLVCAWLFYARLRRPPRRTYASAVARGEPGDPSELPRPRAFESWALRDPIGGVELPVWDIPGDDPGGPAAILTPGWGDSRVGALARLGAFLPVCSRVLAWDPPGLGESPARSRCALGAREDAAILELVRATGRPVVLFGWSMGAGVSLACAARADARELPIAGVVCEAPYRMPWTPAFRVMDLAGYPWRLTGPLALGALGLRLRQGLLWREFDRARLASRVAAPVLVIHGSEDEACPAADGHTIAHAAHRGRFEVIPRGGHNNLWTDPAHAARCAELVRSFIRSL